MKVIYLMIVLILLAFVWMAISGKSVDLTSCVNGRFNARLLCNVEEHNAEFKKLREEHK